MALLATYTGTYGSRVAPLPPVTPRCLPSEIEDSCYNPWSSEAGSSCSTTMAVASILSRAYKTEPVRLKWDMTFPFAQSFDRKVRVSTSASVAALREPALLSTTDALIVVLVGTPYPYEILVKPSSDSSAPSYVTAQDVLRAVYASLHSIVAAGEMNSARKCGNFWEAAWAAYMRRTGGSSKEPFKRIDFLAGRTVFFGMEHVGLAGKLPKLELLVGHRPSS
ncbi:hypothetical protein C8Q72DRAFT_888250 [Fomitopsis betulina]|nr:hypothetical protein C8Q72DRAFT_888250 [Fomitopsis betulina]